MSELRLKARAKRTGLDDRDTYIPRECVLALTRRERRHEPLELRVGSAHREARLTFMPVVGPLYPQAWCQKKRPEISQPNGRSLVNFTPHL